LLEIDATLPEIRETKTRKSPFLAALSVGPLSIIVSITGLHFVIAVLLSVIVYKEKLSRTRLLGMALAVASILFLRA
jgi:uncharacterized membrane protein